MDPGHLLYFGFLVLALAFAAVPILCLLGALCIFLGLGIPAMLDNISKVITDIAFWPIDQARAWIRRRWVRRHDGSRRK